MRIAFDSPTFIPGNTLGTRRKLVFRNTGVNTFNYSWTKGDADGIPVQAGTTQPFGEPVILDFADGRGNQPIYVTPVTPGQGCILAWTEQA